jgi:hypothetical protein
MEKYQQGIISREEATNKCQDPVTMLQKLQEYDIAKAAEAARAGGGMAHAPGQVPPKQ